MNINKIPEFKDIYNELPKEIRMLLDICYFVPQNNKYHPEGTVLNHIKIVYERTKKINNISLSIAAIFHDIGKVFCTKKNKSDNWCSHNHENISIRFVEKYKK